MANETRITIIGRLTRDPELRYTPAGTGVANIDIAANARIYDKQTNEWRDEPAIFWKCNAWRELAENITETLHKGDAVIASGYLKSREWETKEGDKRTSLEVELDGIGPDLRWATANVTRTRQGGNNSDRGGFHQPPPAQQQPTPQTQRPAPQQAALPQQQNTGWTGAPNYDEPPF